MVVIEAARTAYSANDVRRTMTVAELIETLSQFNPDDKVVFSHDNGYTYGGVNESDITEIDIDE